MRRPWISPKGVADDPDGGDLPTVGPGGSVSDVSLPPAGSLFVFEGETLLGADFQRRGLSVDDVSRSSPTRELICSQERCRARPAS